MAYNHLFIRLVLRKNGFNRMQHFFRLLFLALFLIAWGKKDSSVIAASADMHIKHYESLCDGKAETKCLLVQEGHLPEVHEWTPYIDSIEGFNFEDGYNYHLKIRIEKAAKTFSMSSEGLAERKYILLKVVTKERVKQQLEHAIALQSHN